MRGENSSGVMAGLAGRCGGESAAPNVRDSRGAGVRTCVVLRRCSAAKPVERMRYGGGPDPLRRVPLHRTLPPATGVVLRCPPRPTLGLGSTAVSSCVATRACLPPGSRAGGQHAGGVVAGDVFVPRTSGAIVTAAESRRVPAHDRPGAGVPDLLPCPHHRSEHRRDPLPACRRGACRGGAGAARSGAGAAACFRGSVRRCAHRVRRRAWRSDSARGGGTDGPWWRMPCARPPTTARGWLCCSTPCASRSTARDTMRAAAC